jgi:hypothetical protein
VAKVVVVVVVTEGEGVVGFCGERRQRDKEAKR